MSPEAFPKGFHVRKTIAFALVLALLLPIAAFWGWLVLSPKPPLLDGVPFSPLVLDRDGNLLRLGLSEDEKYRVRIRLNEVAPEMVRAVLLYEDRHFYRHPGVNPLSLLRASAGMLGGARRMGGSTITMQVARLRLGLSTTTLSGKFAQMARALQYEYHYGKGEILEAYFNLAPYGGNIEGVGAAARIYFRTTSGRLTRTESLALAVVPQNPVRRSPLNGPDFEAARARMQMLADAEDAPGGGQGATASFGASGFALGRALPPLRVYGPARLPFGGSARFERDASVVAGWGACAHLYRQRVAAAYGEGRCRIRGTGKALWPEQCGGAAHPLAEHGDPGARGVGRFF